MKLNPFRSSPNRIPSETNKSEGELIAMFQKTITRFVAKKVITPLVQKIQKCENNLLNAVQNGRMRLLLDLKKDHRESTDFFIERLNNLYSSQKTISSCVTHLRGLSNDLLKHQETSTSQILSSLATLVSMLQEVPSLLKELRAKAMEIVSLQQAGQSEQSQRMEQLENQLLELQAEQRLFSQVLPFLMPDSASLYNYVATRAGVTRFRAPREIEKMTSILQKTAVLWDSTSLGACGRYLIDHDTELAQRLLELSLAHDPKNIASHRSLALLFLQLNQPEEALDHTIQSFAIHPDQPSQEDLYRFLSCLPLCNHPEKYVRAAGQVLGGQEQLEQKLLTVGDMSYLSFFRSLSVDGEGGDEYSSNS